MSQTGHAREHLIETYRKRAKHYDITSRFYPAPGYPQRTQRLRAVEALGLHPGDRVVDIACGTGLNFALIEQAIGPNGRIVGVDLTDAMLAQALRRLETNSWSNISLVQADAAGFNFPTPVDAILSTYALCQVPECAEVIAHGAAALSHGGRWVVLDLKLPDSPPRWPTQLGIAIVRHFAAIDDWIMRRPWDAIRTAMREELTDVSWTELAFGTAFLAAGSRAPGTSGVGPPADGRTSSPAPSPLLRPERSPPAESFASRPARAAPKRPSWGACRSIPTGYFCTTQNRYPSGSTRTTKSASSCVTSV